MYCILNKAIEDLPAFRIGADSRSEHAIVLVPTTTPESYRADIPLATVCLTEPKASWAGIDACEVRWTSLAA